MPALFLNPFLWFASLLALWACWRALRWLGSGGRLPLRARRGTASGFTAAGLSAQVFYGPGARQLIDANLRQSSKRESDDEGDPPASGDER